MWPWGHLAVGYLSYVGLARWRDDAAPTGAAALAVAVGTQFPDLVDKPLAWVVGLLASGRSFAHSALTATVVCGALGAYAHRRGRTRVALAFAVGYFSHLVTDAIAPVLGGKAEYIAYLGWPVLDQPVYDSSMSFTDHLVAVELTPYLVVQFGLAAVAFVVWLRDGRPGLATVRGWLGRARADR